MLKGLLEGKKLKRAALKRALEEEYPIKEVPVPKLKDLPTKAVMSNALNKDQREKIGLLDQIDPNELVTLRQDVESMTKHGVGIVVAKGTKVTTYENFVRILDPQLVMTEAMQRRALRIGAGEQKDPTMVIKGRKHPRQILPKWITKETQGGFNPDRHGYIYERKAPHRLITGGTEAVQVGNTVFVKNAKFGDESGALYMPAGKDIEVAPGLVRAKVDSEFKLSETVLAQYMPAGKKVDIMAYADRDMFTLAADNLGVGKLEVGPTGAKAPIGIEAQGGRGFQFLDPKRMIWAFSDRGGGNRLLKRGRDVSGGKNTVIVGITSQGTTTQFNSPYGLVGFARSLEVGVESGKFSRRRMDQHVKDLMNLVGRTTDKKFSAEQRKVIGGIKGLASLKQAVNAKKINFNTAGIIK
jgi:hypothetical protein